MERLTFRNSRDLTLVGDLYPAAGDAAVIMAHGFMNDRHSDGRFPKIARALNRAGYSALAFDFSGCGESDDDSLTAAKQVDDLQCAIALMRTRGFVRLALWGNSLGGRICLQADTAGIATLVLTGGGTGPVPYRWEDYFPAAPMTELAQTGRMTIVHEGRSRGRIVIDRQMLADFAALDQPTLLGRLRCPVLVIHGDGDEEERQLLALARQGMAHLPAGSRLEVIPGAAHGFRGHLDRVIELGVTWLARQMPAVRGLPRLASQAGP
ncbi:MAG: alpha/beta hydrolase, partial [Hypericibacter sp.]